MVLVQRKAETIQEERDGQLFTKLVRSVLLCSGVETWITWVLSYLIRLGKIEV